MKVFSLRWRLVRILLLQMTVIILLSGVLALAFIYHEVDEVYDATLVQFSRSLASMPVADAQPNQFAGMDRAKDMHLAHRYERKISYRILKNGEVITQSLDGPDMQNIFLPPGFSDLHRDKKGRYNWRVYTLLDEKNGLTIEVAEKYDIRRELTFQLLSSLMIPGILFLLGSVAAIWWGTSFGLRQLVRVSGEVNARRADDLSAIDFTHIPSEIQPLAQALNDLFSRIEQSFAREREFTDNAAHELRTPLAAIKTQAQTLLRSENLSDEGHAGLENLVSSIDRAADMTDALLSFARLQGDRSAAEPVDLCAVITQEVQALAPYAQSRKVHIVLDLADAPQSVKGVRHALALMVRNVLHNAIKFSATDSTVTASLKAEGENLRLSIIDAGPGIAEKHLPHIFERFYRSDKSQSGAGLGLSIVKWVADIHQAQITLSKAESTGGICFEITFSKPFNKP
jgi:signal transduction histidine kinase